MGSCGMYSSQFDYKDATRNRAFADTHLIIIYMKKLIIFFIVLFVVFISIFYLKNRYKNHAVQNYDYIQKISNSVDIKIDSIKIKICSEFESSIERGYLDLNFLNKSLNLIDSLLEKSTKSENDIMQIIRIQKIINKKLILMKKDGFDVSSILPSSILVLKDQEIYNKMFSKLSKDAMETTLKQIKFSNLQVISEFQKLGWESDFDYCSL